MIARLFIPCVVFTCFEQAAVVGAVFFMLITISENKKQDQCEAEQLQGG